MNLFFRKYGEGYPLIILHGLFGSSDNWVSVAKGLGDRFMVILPDQRNHGNSPESSIHDYDALSTDIFELAADLKLERFFLAGHSMGGKCAIRFALRWPEKLLGLLVADISPFLSESDHKAEYKQHLEILRTIVSTDLSKLHSRSEIEAVLSARIKSERTLGLIMKNIRRNDNHTFSWRINAPALIDNLDQIMSPLEMREGFRTPVTGFPVLFLKGSNSDYLPVSDFGRILNLFPGAEFMELPGAGHWVHTDNPEAVREGFYRLLGSAS